LDDGNHDHKTNLKQLNNTITKLKQESTTISQEKPTATSTKENIIDNLKHWLVSKKERTSTIIKKLRATTIRPLETVTKANEYIFEAPEDTIKFIEQSKKILLQKEEENQPKTIEPTSTITDIDKFNHWKLRITQKQKYKDKFKKEEKMTAPTNYYASLSNDNEENQNEEDQTNQEEQQEPMGFLVEKVNKIKNTRKLNIQQDEETSWETVGARQTKKEQKIVHETKSGRYLPYSLPEYENESEMEMKTNIILPITVKIIPPKKGLFEYKNSRVLVAILKAFQMIEPETYIGTIIDNDPDYPVIHRAFEIPVEEEYISKYMEDPTIGKDKVYSARVFLMTNFHLEHYKQNLSFINYLKVHKIKVEYNDLDTVNLINVGFMRNITPRFDTLGLQQERLEKACPPGTPRFQVSLQSLHAGTGFSSCKILMIKCDKHNLNNLIQVFDKLNQHGVWNFFPFNAFNIMSTGCKITLIKAQVKWSTIYRSLVLKGFNNGRDHIKMHHDPSNDTTMNNNEPYSHITVGEYFRKHVKSSSGDNMFEYVFPTIKGTREFLVCIDKYPEATSFLESARGELYKRMNSEAREAVFDDVESVADEAVNNPWRPLITSYQVEETPLEKNHDEHSYRKRGRGGGIEPNSTANVWNRNHHSNRTTDATDISTAGLSTLASTESKPNVVIASKNSTEINSTKTVVNEFVTKNTQRLAGLETDIDNFKHYINQRIENIANDAVDTNRKIVDLGTNIARMEESIDSKNNAIKQSITEELKIEMKLHSKENNNDLKSFFEQILEKQATSIDNKLDKSLQENTLVQNTMIQKSMEELEQKTNQKFSQKIDRHYKSMTTLVNNLVGKQTSYKTRLSTKYAGMINKKLGFGLLDESFEDDTENMDHESELPTLTDKSIPLENPCKESAFADNVPKNKSV
jgi:hypothetical protein